MSKTYVKAGDLVGYRLRTLDTETAALRDLILDVAAWQARYLSVDADAWAPSREVLVAPRSVTGIDEPARSIWVGLRGEQLRESPSIDLGSRVTRDFEETFHRFHGWEEQWRVQIDAESAGDAPSPTAPPAAEPLPAEVNADTPGLMRLEELLTWTCNTADDQVMRIGELLLDDSDWSIPYLELLLDDPPDTTCLVQRALVASADPVARKLHLESRVRDLLQAERHPYPATGKTRRETRILERRAA